MKRLNFFIVILFSFLIFSTSSCSDNKSNEQADQKQVVDENNTENNTTEQPQNTQPQTNVTEVTNAEVIILTTETFKTKIFDYEKNKEWKYLGDKPAIIDFYADWCKPCKMIEPILDDLAKEYAGKIYVYRLNVDENREVAQVFGIQSIPSVLFIPLNSQPQMAVGARDKNFYVSAIKDVLKIQ